jgi:transposase-like protein
VQSRDGAAAKRFFRRALAAANHPSPRVINVDGNASYPKVVKELKHEQRLGRRCRCRACPYLHDLVEQDQRAIERRINAQQGLGSFAGARPTIQGYEVMHIIRKGQVRRLLKGDVAGPVLLIHQVLELKAF